MPRTVGAPEAGGPPRQGPLPGNEPRPGRPPIFSSNPMKSHPLRIKISRIGEPLLADYQLARSALDCPSEVFGFWNNLVAAQPDFEQDKEHLVAIMLNTKLRPTCWHLVATGTLNECVAHPREIFRPAILSSAYALVLAHNHPSGDPAPSGADQKLTRRLRDAGGILEIQLLDHVVVGTPAGGRQPFYSFRESGLL